MPGRRSNSLLLLLSLLLPTLAGAVCDRELSQYRLRVWQTEDGLPLDAVYAIAQTPDRFLWVATEDGLARFDGVAFHRVDLSTVLGDAPEYIQSLLVPTSGELLAGSVSPGLLRLERTGAPGQLALDIAVRHLLQTRDEVLWLGSRSEGLRAWAEGGEPVEVVGARSAQITALARRRVGGVWVGYADAGIQFAEGAGAGDLAPDGGLHRTLKVLSVVEDSAGVLWVGAREGLFRWDASGLSRVAAVDDAVSALLEDDAGALWIGRADGGVGRLCGNAEADWFLPEDGFPAGPVKTIFQDEDKSVWVGLHGGGLVQLARGAALPVTAAQGLPARPVLPILQTRDGSIWIGTFGGGLVRYVDGETQLITEREGLASDWVFSLGEGRDGELWVGTRSGVSLLRDGKPDSVIGLDDGLPAATAIALLPDGDALWIGSPAGLVRWQSGAVQEYAASDGPVASPVTRIFRRRDGTLLVATDGDGVYRMERDVLVRPPYAEQLPSPLVYAFHEQEDGVLWVTTARGLLRWDGRQAQTVTAANGLPDPHLFSMQDDDRGAFWFSGNRGVFKVDGTELQAVAASGGHLLSIERFSAVDGMPRTETNGGFQPSSLFDAGGRLWYPTSDGIAVFDPGVLAATSSRVPEVFVSAIHAGLDPLPAGKAIQLRPDPPSLRLEYTAPEYLYPQGVSYRYRMRGLEDDWYSASERQAIYHGLPPGEFVFEVQARITQGAWSPSTELAVSVPRHLVETPLFQGVLAISGLVGAGVLYHLWQQRRRRTELRLQHAQKLESIGLLASGVAHDFNNVLQGIMVGAESLQLRLGDDPQVQRDIGTVLRAAEQGVGLSRQLLTFARRQPGAPIPVSLRAELERAAALLRHLLPSSIQFAIDADADVGTCVIDPVQLQQVLLNLVSNARDATPAGGSVRVELKAGDRGWAHLRVIDSGVGIPAKIRERIFEPFFTTKAAGEGTGLGLAVSYGIVEHAGGHIEVTSRRGLGTTFDVVLPVH